MGEHTSSDHDRKRPRLQVGTHGDRQRPIGHKPKALATQPSQGNVHDSKVRVRTNSTVEVNTIWESTKGYQCPTGYTNGVEDIDYKWFCRQVPERTIYYIGQNGRVHLTRSHTTPNFPGDVVPTIALHERGGDSQGGCTNSRHSPIHPLNAQKVPRHYLASERHRQIGERRPKVIAPTIPGEGDITHSVDDVC